MNRLLQLLTLVAFAVVLALPASAQSLATERATLAPEPEMTRSYEMPSIVEAARIDEGLAYGHLNRPSADNPDLDTYSSFDPQDPFDAAQVEPYPASAFAGTVLGDGIYYFIEQAAEPTAADKDTLAWYDFDNNVAGEKVGVTFTRDGIEVTADLLPQWVDAGVDTETGDMILLGRFGSCTEEAGGELWRLNAGTLQGEFMMQFTDPLNCPLSMAYDNENGVVIGMLPDDADAANNGFYQTDLSDGSTIATIPLPDDLLLDAIAPFIQGGATNYGLNDDASDNEHYFFLFEGVNPDLVSTSRLINFDGDNIIESSTNFGEIDDSVDWVEVLAVGFPNIAPPPEGADATEDVAAAQALEFVGVYPNPFRSAATVMLRNDEALGQVSVKAYDLLGREVLTLHDGPLSANVHHFGLEAAELPAGVYLVSVRSGDFAQTRKVVLMH